MVHLLLWMAYCITAPKHRKTSTQLYILVMSSRLFFHQWRSEHPSSVNTRILIMEIKKAKILSLWFHKFKKHTESMICCTAATLWVWCESGCCCLSGDMKGRKMEPRQRAACRQGCWASTAGDLSSATAFADVTVSSTYLILPRSVLADLVFCTTNHTGSRATASLSPSPSKIAQKTIQEEKAGSVDFALIYLLLSEIHSLAYLECADTQVQENIDF